jgi:hypothetical protein
MRLFDDKERYTESAMVFDTQIRRLAKSILEQIDTIDVRNVSYLFSAAANSAICEHICRQATPKR